MTRKQIEAIQAAYNYSQYAESHIAPSDLLFQILGTLMNLHKATANKDSMAKNTNELVMKIVGLCSNYTQSIMRKLDTDEIRRKDYMILKYEAGPFKNLLKATMVKFGHEDDIDVMANIFEEVGSFVTDNMVNDYLAHLELFKLPYYRNNG